MTNQVRRAPGWLVLLGVMLFVAAVAAVIVTGVRR